MEDSRKDLAAKFTQAEEPAKKGFNGILNMKPEAKPATIPTTTDGGQEASLPEQSQDNSKSR